MHRHRLERLARLTTGAALIGASALAGCNNETKTINAPDPQPHPNASAEPLHINAPPDPRPSATPSASTTAATPSASASASARPMTHTMNAPAHVNAGPDSSK